jgi:hypothetical protein
MFTTGSFNKVTPLKFGKPSLFDSIEEVESPSMTPTQIMNERYLYKVKKIVLQCDLEDIKEKIKARHPKLLT